MWPKFFRKRLTFKQLFIIIIYQVNLFPGISDRLWALVATIRPPVLVNCIEVGVRRVRYLKGLSLNLSIEWDVLAPVYLHKCISWYRFNQHWSSWLVRDISICIKQHPLSVVAREELPIVLRGNFWPRLLLGKNIDWTRIVQPDNLDVQT